MFVLEIDFHDGVSPPEILLVRRPHAIIGTSDFAHVVIEGAASSFYELRITRGIGREFRCQPISRHDQEQPLPAFLDGVYYGEAELDLGDVTTHLTSVDLDLRLQPGESPDRAGVRVLRRALTCATPLFPAIAVLGTIPLFTSFPVDQPLLIGRSRKCGLRLDSSEISGEHARMGYNDGAFWVEDLGSKNGTFVGGNRISGRHVLSEENTVTLGADFVLAGIRNQQDVAALHQRVAEKPSTKIAREQFPCVVSTSELVRPARFVLVSGMRVSAGRDPANDIWVGAAHISRHHVEIMLANNGVVEILDTSSNGVRLRGEGLARGTTTELTDGLSVLDFGGDITLAVCLSEEDEERFLNADQDALLDVGDDDGEPDVSPQARAVFDTSTYALRAPEQNADMTSEQGGVFERLAERSGNHLLDDDSPLMTERDELSGDVDGTQISGAVGPSLADLANEKNEALTMGRMSRFIVTFSLLGLLVIVSLIIYSLVVV